MALIVHIPNYLLLRSLSSDWQNSMTHPRSRLVLFLLRSPYFSVSRLKADRSARNDFVLLIGFSVYFLNTPIKEFYVIQNRWMEVIQVRYLVR